MEGDEPAIIEDGDYMEWQGTITLEVPLAVRTPAGRPKHVMPEEKGLQLASTVQARLVKFYKDSFDWAIGDVTFASHRDEHWHDWAGAEGLAGLEAEMQTRLAPPVRADTPDDLLSHVPHDISAGRISAAAEILARIGEREREQEAEEVSDEERAALARAAFLAETAIVASSPPMTD